MPNRHTMNFQLGANIVEKEIIVDINPYQTRVVLLEDGSPSEIYIERRGRERLVGNIYKGWVQNVLPGMQAAFVDIGLERIPLCGRHPNRPLRFYVSWAAERAQVRSIEHQRYR